MKASSKQVVRTRMAPSPTGEFHIGGMRTLLYNFAYAKQQNGQFILRIEDTDRARLVEGAVERLLEVIKDYGLSWDEGPNVEGSYSPYVQSERLHIYQKYAKQLVKDEKAYYCFCTADRLEKMREEQKKRGINSTKYDKSCLKLTQEEVDVKLKQNTPFVIRLNVPSNKTVSWVDGVLGKVSFATNEIDDQVLLKSDGFPTYHLGVVVDDHLMEISHVMRGNEWLPSTPKHILLYEAFGWPVPKYYHLPNLKEIGSNKKLSKRHGPVSARAFLDAGYLSEGLVNYLMFLGWNPGTEKEIYSLQEFINDFDIDKIHKADMVAFDRKKLDWYNGHYIRLKSDKELLELLKPFIPTNLDENKLMTLISISKERIKTLKDFWDIAGFVFEEIKVEHDLFTPKYKDHLKVAKEALENTSSWEKANVDKSLLKAVEENNFKTGEFFMDLRVAVSGRKVTPPINDAIVLIERGIVIDRLSKALQ